MSPSPYSPVCSADSVSQLYIKANIRFASFSYENNESTHD